MPWRPVAVRWPDGFSLEPSVMSDLAQPLLTADVVVVIWMAAIGACIGSFLNVVVYRLPHGKSVVYPPSQCPRCGHAIRGYDNVPVISWLVLRGRCRDCQAPISPRYPAVEATTALLFALIAAREILARGQNLPSAAVQAATTAEIWGTGIYHLFLLCALLCVSLIESDGNCVPLRLTATTVFVGLIAPAVAPILRPATWAGAVSADAAPGPIAALATGLVGFSAAVVAGSLAWPAARPVTRHARGPIAGLARGSPERTTTVLVAGFVGAFMGWQAIMVIACIATLLHQIVGWTQYVRGRGPFTPWSTWLAVTTLGYILQWRRLADGFPCLVTTAGWMTFGAAALVLLGLSALAWLVGMRTRSNTKGV